MRTLIVAAVFLLQGAGTTRIAGGVIAGEIRSTDGTPAAGLRVSAVSVGDVAIGGGGNLMLASLAETDSSGRFRLEDLPAGRYYIMAGSVDVASYFPGVRTEAEASVITMSAGTFLSGVRFWLARPAGVRVTGHVTGFPAGGPAGLVRVNLQPQGGLAGAGPMDGPVQADGTFEFAKVPPGRYMARLTPATAPVTTVPFQVDEQDIKIEMTMASMLIGRVVMDDGGKLPVPMAAVAGANPDASFIQLRGRRAAPAPVAAAGGRGGAVAAQFSAAVRADGFFTFPVAPGEYQIAATQLPFGYYIKTIALDRITSQMRITMTTAPPATEPPGVKVSGRIIGMVAAAGGLRWVRMQTAATNANSMGLPEQRIGEAPIRDDGTFELLHVPPGPVTLQVLPNTGTGTLQMRVDVDDRDLSIDFSVTASRPAGERPPPGPAISAPASPFTIIVP